MEEEIYNYILGNEYISEDFFSVGESEEKMTLEKLFSIFPEESVLALKIKIKMLKSIDGDKRSVYQYFNITQTEFNNKFYKMVV
jgi:hypothetical protein